MDTLWHFVVLVLVLARQASSSITVFDDKNSSVVSIEDTSANFGPSISDDGFLGYIAVAKPVSACTPIEPPPANVSYVDAKQWIALVLRTPSATGNCSFDLKVYNAQRAGYAAVIVYNSESDNLIKMSSSGLYNIRIPSVFVGHSSGLEIARYYTYENRTYVVINSEDSDFNYLMVPFIIVISICFFVAIVLFIVKFAIHCHKMRKNRFPKSALKKIPTKKYQKTDKYDTCPICLNEYEEGVKMRILPCEHAYHVECIDKWLLRNNRFCPVCKRRVLPGGPDSDSEENSSDTHTTTSAATATHSGLNHNEQHLDIEANEDEDTNESSRLLVRTVRTRSPEEDVVGEEVESLGSEHRNLSNPNLSDRAAAGNGSLNNQMTTSGSNQVTAATGGAESQQQLKQSSSRYGSICSVNSLSAGNGASAGVLRGELEDEEYERKLKSNNHVILINEAKRKSGGGGKETPEFFTPHSVTSESSAAISSSSFTPVQTDKELKLKTYASKKVKKPTATGKAKSETGASKHVSKRKKSNKVDVIPKDDDADAAVEPSTSTGQADQTTSSSTPSNEPADSCTKINFAYERRQSDDDDDDDGLIDA